MTKQYEFWPSVQKCLKRESEPVIEEYSHFSLLFKQLTGLIIGITFGILGIQGMIGFIGFILVSSLLSLVYAKNYLGIDEEDIENFKLLSEGFFPGFILFLLSWIMMFTFVHHSN